MQWPHSLADTLAYQNSKILPEMLETLKFEFVGLDVLLAGKINKTPKFVKNIEKSVLYTWKTAFSLNFS